MSQAPNGQGGDGGEKHLYLVPKLEADIEGGQVEPKDSPWQKLHRLVTGKLDCPRLSREDSGEPRLLYPTLVANSAQRREVEVGGQTLSGIWPVQEVVQVTGLFGGTDFADLALLDDDELLSRVTSFE